jgi:hypothetical protein
MAIEYSTALRNYLQNFGSKKQSLEGGTMQIWSGAAPASPDDAATGTLLCEISLASAAFTDEAPSRGTVTISVDGTVTGITVNGVQIMSGTVTAQGTVTATAAAVASNINAFISEPNYRAWNVAGVVVIEAMPGLGTAPNAYAVVSAGGATTADANMGSGGVAQAGVAAANGLTFGESVAGLLSKSGVWSGVNLATGVAGYFRLCGRNEGDVTNSTRGDADASPWHLRRVQGTCGTAGADYNMGSTALTISETHTVNTGTINLEEEE